MASPPSCLCLPGLGCRISWLCLLPAVCRIRQSCTIEACLCLCLRREARVLGGRKESLPPPCCLQLSGLARPAGLDVSSCRGCVHQEVPALGLIFFPLSGGLFQPSPTAPRSFQGSDELEKDMTRRCSHCGQNGHNSRTCPDRGVRLFGVRLTDGVMRKSASMGNLCHYASSSNPPSTPEHSESGAANDGYVSDGLVQTSSNARERKKGDHLDVLYPDARSPPCGMAWRGHNCVLFFVFFSLMCPPVIAIHISIYPHGTSLLCWQGFHGLKRSTVSSSSGCRSWAKGIGGAFQETSYSPGLPHKWRAMPKNISSGRAT